MPKKRKKMTSVIYILIILFVAYILIGLLLYFAQPFLLYFPSKKIFSTPAEIDLKFEQVSLVTSDNVRISAWFIPAEKAEYTVIYCHGNGGNLSYYLNVVAFLNGLNLNCLAFDYRGYGDSSGRQTEQGTYLDAEAAYNWVVKEKNISPDKIIIFGWSLGGAIAAHLAAKVDCAALVLDSAFTNYADIAQKHFFFLPIKLFAKYNYNTFDYIKNIRCPVMIIHSRDDEVAPFRFGEKLFEAAKEPKKFVETAGRHNDAFAENFGVYKKAWQEFLQSIH
jgi:fermentation-respiration switch protein FrsA (DUF1100 family)